MSTAKKLVITSEIDPSIIYKVTETFKDILLAIAQLVENSIDWGANRVTIRFSRAGGKDCLSVIDDGSGFSDEGLKAFFSLGMSDARSDPKKKGRNGTGLKGAVQQCERIRLETKRSNSPLYVVEYSVDEFQQILFQRRDPRDFITSSPLPPRHDIRTTGSIVQWIGLRARGARRTPEFIIENLARYLAPHMAERVQVEDAREGRSKGKAVALQPIELVGKRIRGTEQVPGVGDVSYDIAVAAKMQDGFTQRVMVGSMGPVCTWDEFVDPVRDKRFHRLLCRDVLCHPQVTGHIDVPDWNKRYATNARRGGFDQDLYEELEIDGRGMLFGFLSFVRTKLVLLVERELGITTEELTSDKHDRLCTEIVRSIQEKTGRHAPQQPVDGIAWDVSQRRLTLECGDDTILEIEDPRPGATYVWETKECGGTVSPHVGTRVTYKAGRAPGSFKLKVKDAGAPQQERSVQIFLKEELPLAITPPAVTVEVGREQVLRLRNTRHTSGRFHWHGQGSGGELRVDDSGLAATYTAGRVPGEFTVAVEDAQAPERYRVACQIAVVPAGHKEPPRTRDREEFVVGNRGYILRISLFAEQPTLLSWLVEGSGDGHATIYLNGKHPALQGNKSEAVFKTLVLREIALQAGRNELPQGTIGEVFNRAAEITALLLG